MNRIALSLGFSLFFLAAAGRGGTPARSENRQSVFTATGIADLLKGLLEDVQPKGGAADSAAPGTSGLIQPSDLAYAGAFRLPEGSGGSDWTWGGSAMTYCPGGDPAGPDDGYPGSIFGTGHEWKQFVSEIGIPAPVVSPGKNPADLNAAATLQEFHNIRGDLFPFDAYEIPRVGLEYLPAQGSQSAGKLHFCWGQHLQEGETNPSHGWCELDLSNPRPSGPWRIGEFVNYVTNDYIFSIPADWADANTPGLRLATGRFRDGGQGGEGPSLIAYGPWNQGNPPSSGTTLSATALLLYGNAYESQPAAMNGYHHSDEWSGGAWLTAGGRSAVIFVGTKGTGNCWYGLPDGTVWPEEGPYPEDTGNRGWWSTGFIGQIIFYDPAALAAVARGEQPASSPQPYATLDIDGSLFHVTASQQKSHVGAAAFDRDHGILYVFEPLADGDKPLVHAWKIR